jgi:hypothetical protein
VAPGWPLALGDRHAFRQGPVDRTPRRDLGQPLTLLVGEVAAEEQLQLDAVDLPLPRIAGEARLDAVERPALAFGIQPNREDRSGAEGGQERFRRGGPGVLAPVGHGLVHEQAVRPDARFRLQVAEPGDFHRSCHVLPLC